MSEYLALPQGITTLADARPGVRFIVHSLLSTRDLPAPARALSAGECLVCTRLLEDVVEFERADGSRFRIGKPQLLRIRVDRFEDETHEFEHNGIANEDTGDATEAVTRGADEGASCTLCRL